LTKTIFCMEVGRRIAAIRTQKHMTQQQVAEAAGITTPYYSQIETGNKTASSYVLTRIIEVLEISSDYILFGRFPDHDDALKRLCDKSTDVELTAIRRFVDSCDQQLRAAEAERDTSGKSEEDSSASVSVSP